MSVIISAYFLKFSVPLTQRTESCLMLFIYFLDKYFHAHVCTSMLAAVLHLTIAMLFFLSQLYRNKMIITTLYMCMT